MHALYGPMLREILERFGREICDDPARLKAVLCDYAGGRGLDRPQREIRLLVYAAEERVPEELLRSPDSGLREVLKRRLAARLQSSFAITGEHARWAMETWAFALGLATSAPEAPPASPSAEAEESASVPRAPRASRRSPSERPTAEGREPAVAHAHVATSPTRFPRDEGTASAEREVTAGPSDVVLEPLYFHVLLVLLAGGSNAIWACIAILRCWFGWLLLVPIGITVFIFLMVGLSIRDARRKGTLNRLLPYSFGCLHNAIWFFFLLLGVVGTLYTLWAPVDERRGEYALVCLFLVAIWGFTIVKMLREASESLDRYRDQE